MAGVRIENDPNAQQPQGGSRERPGIRVLGTVSFDEDHLLSIIPTLPTTVLNPTEEADAAPKVNAKIVPTVPGDINSIGKTPPSAEGQKQENPNGQAKS